MKAYNTQRFCISAPHLAHADGTAVLEVETLSHYRPADTVALLFHPNPVDGGSMDNKVVSTLLRFCRDQGMDVLRYNSRGVGASSGVAVGRIDAELDDALCVLDWLKQYTHATRICLAGFSFGGVLACHVADVLQAEQGAVAQAGFVIDALALIAPSIERHDVSRLNVPWSRTFVIYGDRDGLVSPAALANFTQRHQLANTVMTGVGHLFHGQLISLMQALIALYAQIKTISN